MRAEYALHATTTPRKKMRCKTVGTLKSGRLQDRMDRGYQRMEEKTDRGYQRMEEKTVSRGGGMFWQKGWDRGFETGERRGKGKWEGVS